MESQDREALVAILAGYLNQKAIDYLKEYHYGRLTYTDDSKEEFREANEISSVYAGIESAAIALSKEIIEEEEAKGLEISKSEEELAALLTNTLRNEVIIQKIYDKIDKLVNDLP
jgi:hypothetical protein